MNEPKIICPVCSHENVSTAKLCIKCQAVLHAQTHKIDPPQDIAAETRMGTKTIEKKLYLHVKGTSDSLEVELEDGAELTIGRFDVTTGKGPPIDLSKFGAEENGISRNHAVITYRTGSLRVADLDSPNFTYLNGQRLIPNQARILRDGDELRLGRMLLTVQFGG